MSAKTGKDIFRIENLGKAAIVNPVVNHSRVNPERLRFTDDKDRLPRDIIIGADAPEKTENPSFELAGLRKKIYFDPFRATAAIVTCGGLCPGLNDVIRAVFMELHHVYGIRRVLGVRYGYSGLAACVNHQPIEMTHDTVNDIHIDGGTILGSSRGGPPVPEIVDTLDRQEVDMLFCVGGDGTLRGANEIHHEIKRRGLKKAVIGIPKTIDNDVPFVYRSFGFQTAVEEARKVLDCAHVEAKGARNGIGLVKLMGRDAGFVSAYATRASGDVNFCLIPEIRFPLDGENGFLECLLHRVRRRQHAVVVVSEGAGQHLIGRDEATDASGNKRYKDVGNFMKEQIRDYFNAHGEACNIKYFDPSYIIRSVPANAEDSSFCADFGRFAVDAAMAGKTGMLIGHWHGVFTHVPFDAINKIKKRVSPDQQLWRGVLATTGQPVGW